MRWQQSYLTDIDLIDKIMIFNQGKGTGGSQVNRHKARIESLLYFANLSSSACAICTGSWWSLDVDILGQCYWNDWIQCQLEYLLPPGPSFCGCESCFLVDRVELSMISEDHILTLCFWDRSNELVPGSQSKLNSPLSWNRGRTLLTMLRGKCDRHRLGKKSGVHYRHSQSFIAKDIESNTCSAK
jgi:hypothetical protein